MTSAVTVRDRRTLPFFMVRLEPLQEIRNNISGPRRARALGMYALLCQMANEQRAKGEQRRVIATYKQLTARGGLSPNSLKVILRALENAGAAHYQVRIDPLRGSMPSLIELPRQDGAWFAISVHMADHLGRQTAIRLLPALGLLVVLLEFCDEQRESHGGMVAETTRTQIARRLGCSTDSLDAWAKALQGAGVLTVTRRQGEGGANLPNLWEICEVANAGVQQDDASATNPNGDGAEADDDQQAGRRAELPAPTADIGLAENQKHPPGEPDAPTPRAGDCLAAAEKCHTGEAATPASDQRPFNARRRNQPEGPTTENSVPPTPAISSDSVGEGGMDQEAIDLCRALLAVLEATRGSGPTRRYGEDSARWHAAAHRVLAEHPVDKVLDAIAYLERDHIIGTKVRSMPDLEHHIEDLRHRAHAASRQHVAPEQSSAGDAPPWALALGQIKVAIRSHGAGGAAAARTQLDAKHSAYGRFIDAVGWSSLCHDNSSYSEYDWKRAWEQACTTSTQEAAA